MAGQSAGHAMTAASSDGNRAPALQTHMELRTPERDRNREFLCTYGYAVSSYFNSFSSEVFEGWQHYAVPIRGEGASVSEIVVTDSQPSGSISSDFTVGIYKNTNGRPGKLIAGGTGQAQGSCLPTKVVIPKTFLAAGKKYWIEENARLFQPPQLLRKRRELGIQAKCKAQCVLPILQIQPAIELPLGLAPRIRAGAFCESEVRQQWPRRLRLTIPGNCSSDRKFDARLSVARPGSLC
jgi:hypothetical protein